MTNVLTIFLTALNLNMRGILFVVNVFANFNLAYYLLPMRHKVFVFDIHIPCVKHFPTLVRQ